MSSEIELEGADIKDVSAEVLDHMMNPRNYGKMENADGVGMGIDEKTGEFVIFYVKAKNEVLTGVNFVANACQDTIISGSLFSEMIDGDEIKNAIKASEIMSEKLVNAPAKQQACASMVLLAFEASLKHLDQKVNGSEEEMFTLKMDKTCEVEENE